MENENPFIEVDEPIVTLPKEGGLECAGNHGETDGSAMAWRKRRTTSVKDRADYRRIVPCDRCANCLEFRKFTKKGEIVLGGYFCLVGEFETEADATCNSGAKRKKDRRKIVYDTTNAPLGFMAGMVQSPIQGVPSEDTKHGEETRPLEGYRGGSKYYKRKDGDTEAEGTGKIPRGLMN